MAAKTKSARTQPLIGRDEANLDDKGRIHIVKKKRDRLGDRFAMMLGNVGCIEALPMDQFERILSEIQSGEAINQGRQQLSRLVLGYAEDDCKFDKQGRVVIPKNLREAAKLSDKVLVIGCGDRLEIWDVAEYGKFDSDPERHRSDRRVAIENAYRKMKGSE